MIAFAEVSIGKSPETPCVRCALGPAVSMHPATLVLEQVASACDSWSDGPGPNVAFIGAEPFAHPELPLLVQGAVQAGCERIRLRTDAGALSFGDNASGVVGAGVRHLEVVVLGGGSGTHDALVGRAGAFDAASAGVTTFVSAARAACANVAVTGRVPVCRHNRDDLTAIVGALVALGAVSIEIAAVGGISLDDERVRAARQTAVVNGAWLHVAGSSVGPASWFAAGGAT